MIGQVFSRLTVLSVGPGNKCVVRCQCGIVKTAIRSQVASGASRSCGCLRREMVSARRLKHGKTATREYRIWSKMKARCSNPSSTGFKEWGGRGIKVCQAWLESFETFSADMGACPPGYSIDRIDNDGDYEPGNCRWTTRKVQMNNVRKNIRVEHQGRTATIAEWAEELGLRYATLHRRIVIAGERPPIAFRTYLAPGKKAA